MFTIIGAIFRVVRLKALFNICMICSENDFKSACIGYWPSQSQTATPLRHLGSLGENFLVNNCGMYDLF